MLVQRSGARRGRAATAADDANAITDAEDAIKDDAGVESSRRSRRGVNNRNRVGEGEVPGVATWTRRRSRAGAVAAVAEEEAGVGVVTAEEGAVGEERAVVAVENAGIDIGGGARGVEEGVGEKLMEGFNSGVGKSNKGNAGEDEGSTAPLPEKVRRLFPKLWTFLLVFLFLG